MELRQLEAFVAVAEEGSFTAAAGRLHVVQSGVSATVRRLEAELGVRLLERTSRRVAVSEEGRAFLPLARQTLDAANAAVDVVTETSAAGLRGTLRLGSVSSLGLLDLPGVLGRFCERHPGVDVRLTVSTSGSAGLTDALLAGRLDLAVASLPPPVPVGLRFTELLRLPVDLLVPEGHRFARRSDVELADIASERFVEMPVGFGSRRVTDAAFATRGLARHIALEVTDLERVADFVRHGLGIVLSPRFAGRDEDGLVSIRIAREQLWWPLAAVEAAHRRTGAAARSVLELLGAQAQQMTREPSLPADRGSRGRRDGRVMLTGPA